MFTRHRFKAPILSGDWKTDGPNLLRAINEYWLALEQKNALTLAQAQIYVDQGLQFPATQVASSDAHNLDDYSEQTTTPVPTSGTGTLTTASSALETTKIGNRVFVSGVLTITNAGTGGQDLRVTLPYTAATISGGGGVNLGSGASLAVRASGSTLIVTDNAGAFPGAGTYTVGVQFRV